MSNTTSVPQADQFTGKTGSVKTDKVDKLSADKRRWSGNMLKALGLSSSSAQGRMMAGAVASAALIEKAGNQNDTKKANGLRDTVLAAGKPPWKDVRKAMSAGAAKVELDILTIPPNQRDFSTVANQGINKSYWIERMEASNDAAGVKRSKAFLCKPATKQGGMSNTMPSGGPKGGEVAREALAGRAAQLIAAQTGIDIGMPETHVVQLDGGMMPGGTQGQMVTCSVQEARPGESDMMASTSYGRGSYKKEQVAGLAIYDTLTLNTDRHGGNVMLDKSGNLIPIDHGESFAESNEDGISRIARTMGGPHNALLSIPSAFEPMSKDMVKQLKAFDPVKYKVRLGEDSKAIGEKNPDMAGAVSDGAVDNAYRAAVFTKLAARRTPPMSPGAIQIAMGTAAPQLFGPNITEAEFRANTEKVLNRLGPQTEVAKQICTSENAEYSTLLKQVQALGWKETELAKRFTAPDGDIIVDPLILIQIVQKKISPPTEETDQAVIKQSADDRIKQWEAKNGKKADDNRKARTLRTEAKTMLGEAHAKVLADLGAPNAVTITPNEALKCVAELRVQTLRGLMGLMPTTEMAKIRAQIVEGQVRAGQDLKALLHELSLLMPAANTAALIHQKNRLDAFVATNRITELMAVGFAVGKQVDTYHAANSALEHQDAVDLADQMNTLDKEVAAGNFLPSAVKKVDTLIREDVAAYPIPKNDRDLLAARQALARNDPFQGTTYYEALHKRVDAGSFNSEAFDAISAEFDSIEADYMIAQDDPSRTELAAAFQKQDVKAAAAAVKGLRNRLKALPPKPAGLDKLFKALHVPDDDFDRDEAFAAFNSGDPDEVLARIASARQRAKDGDFGPNGTQAAGDQMAGYSTLVAEVDAFVRKNAIDPDNYILLEIRELLDDKRADGNKFPQEVEALLARLSHLVAQGRL